jgi:predicted RNA-binding protein with PIN domain
MSLLYIVDGYNLINHPLFLPKDNPKGDIRLALLNYILANRLTGSSKNRVCLVFDGYPPRHWPKGAEGDMAIVFSRKVSADEKIKNMVEESAGRRSIVVVSDDKEIMFLVRSLGASYMGIEEFFARKKDREPSQRDVSASFELSYSQMHRINEELRKIWLKE